MGERNKNSGQGKEKPQGLKARWIQQSEQHAQRPACIYLAVNRPVQQLNLKIKSGI